MKFDFQLKKKTHLKSASCFLSKMYSMVDEKKEKKRVREELLEIDKMQNVEKNNNAIKEKEFFV